MRTISILTVFFLIVNRIKAVVFNILNAISYGGQWQNEVQHVDILLLIKSSISFYLLHPGSVFWLSYMFHSHRFHAVFVTPIWMSHLTKHSIRTRQKSLSVVVTLEAAALSHSSLQKSSVFMLSGTCHINVEKQSCFFYHNCATLPAFYLLASYWWIMYL